MPRTPLYDTLAAEGAAFGEEDGWEVALRFGDAAAEYARAARLPSLADRSADMRLRITGSKRQDYLQRISSNDMNALLTGHGVENALLSPKGRFVAHLVILERSAHYLALGGAAARERAIQWIKKFRFGDDVQVEDATESTAEIAVFGPGAARLVEKALGIEVEALKPNCLREAALGDRAVTAVRRALPEGGGFALIVEAAGAAELWGALRGAGETNPVGAEAYEWLRVKAGLAREGHEITGDSMPVETEQNASFSLTKGCYTGQEVVAKLWNYKAIPRKLRGVVFKERVALAPDHFIQDKKRNIGRVTSLADLPGVPHTVGLALVRTEQSEPGTEIVVQSGEREIPATVAALPLAL